MKLITEINDEFEVITEAKKDGGKNYFIEGVFMQSDIKNKNGRLYPQKVLQTEATRYNKEYVQKNRAYGELGHPQGPTINLDRVSHMIKELKEDGNNWIGKAKILDTPAGRIVQNLMDEGAQLAVSTRGMGSLKSVNGINEVQNDFKLATAADIVADPSAPNAFVNGIMEGVEFWFDVSRNEWVTEKTRNQIEEDVRHKRLTENRKMQLLENFLRNI